MASDLVQSVVRWEEVMRELAFYVPDTEGKKTPTPPKQTYNKEPDWFITALMFNFGCII